MHEGFVIPVKSDVEYLNWLLKPTSTLKYPKGTSTLKSTVLLSLISPRFPLGEFQIRHLLWRRFFLQFQKTD